MIAVEFVSRVTVHGVLAVLSAGILFPHFIAFLNDLRRSFGLPHFIWHQMSMAASLSRLTSLSTQTLSLLLERQRLQSLPSNSTSLHTPQIVKNLQQLRAGILDLEEKEGPSEATKLLRTQHERMRGMLGGEPESMGAQRYVPSCTTRAVFCSCERATLATADAKSPYLPP